MGSSWENLTTGTERVKARKVINLSRTCNAVSSFLRTLVLFFFFILYIVQSGRNAAHMILLVLYLLRLERLNRTLLKVL